MEAPAYNNSAIAGLVLADAGDVIAFRWRRRGTADPNRLRVRFSKAATDSVEPRAFVALGVNGGFDRVHARHLASQATLGANLIVESLEPGLDLDGEIGKLAPRLGAGAALGDHVSERNGPALTRHGLVVLPRG
jgi:hypothetical protein